mmetsp:Transcript_8934/g.27747  ORF Transcript_8934/g.27747 Transcript_8934/m.27747 type:complete len:253 (+) Transcript_8934:579-1337(+)
MGVLQLWARFGLILALGRSALRGDLVKLPAFPLDHGKIRVLLKPLRVEHQEHTLPLVSELRHHCMDLRILKLSTLMVLVVEAHVGAVDDDIIGLLLFQPALELAEVPVAPVVVRQSHGGGKKLSLLVRRNIEGLQPPRTQSAGAVGIHSGPTYPPSPALLLAAHCHRRGGPSKTGSTLNAKGPADLLQQGWVRRQGQLLQHLVQHLPLTLRGSPEASEHGGELHVLRFQAQLRKLGPHLVASAAVPRLCCPR